MVRSEMQAKCWSSARFDPVTFATHSDLIFTSKMQVHAIGENPVDLTSSILIVVRRHHRVVDSVTDCACSLWFPPVTLDN